MVVAATPAPPRAGVRSWALLAFLVGVWGTAFLFTEIGLREVGPAPLAAIRVLVATAAIQAARWWSGRRLPGPGRIWLHFAALAVCGTVLPFLLIAWGQQQVPSGLAGLWMAVMPLATIGLAHFTVQGERLGPARVLGFGLGFAGVALLLGPDALADSGTASAPLSRQLAVLGGALCYAVNTILARRLPPLHPLVSASAVLSLAAPLLLALAWVSGGPPPLPGAAAGLSIVWLGLLPTAAATVAHFALVSTAGAGFASATNYGIPVVAVVAGALVLGESVAPTALVALALILAGLSLSERGAGR